MNNKFLLYFICSSFLYFSCASDGNDGEDAYDETDSTSSILDSANVKIDTLESDSTVIALDTVKIEIPMLSKIIEEKAKPVVKEQFSHYLNALQLPSEIKEEADIKQVIFMRDSLISTLQYGFLEEYYYKELEGKENEQATLENEFAKIGIQPVYAEGNVRWTDRSTSFSG